MLRFRAHGQPGAAAIREEIILAVRQLGRNLNETDRKSQGFVNIAMEIDFERFGLAAEPTRGGPDKV